jgi:hypothetical protein
MPESTATNAASYTTPRDTILVRGNAAMEARLQIEFSLGRRRRSSVVF